MASPQCEKGYTKIANELLEALLRAEIGTLARALLWIIRNTYGWGGEEMLGMSAYAMSAGTGMGYRQAKRIFVCLRQSGIITDKGIQKDYEKWKPITMAKPPPSQKRPQPIGAEMGGPNDPGHIGPGVYMVENGGLDGHKGGHLDPHDFIRSLKKERNKEGGSMRGGVSTNLPPPAGFAAFWAAYPRKTAKVTAIRAWRRIADPRPSTESIVAALQSQKENEGWDNRELKYIPHPATWINGRRWEDEAAAPAANDDYPDLPGLCKKCKVVHYWTPECPR